MPAAGTTSTQRMLPKSQLSLPMLMELQPIISAAHVDSANDPKRSAPMPAMSPTLSPTLSAIVAGFLGLSSGRPLSILPTRSEPRSAAFVKMPPPTRAKRATVDPPSPNPATASKRNSKYLGECEASASARRCRQVSISTSRVSREAATSANPMTTPARQATLNALPSEFLAQMVVLKLERVAMCMPKAPQAIEVPAPTRNATVVQAPTKPSTHAQTMLAMATMKIAQLRYSETMNSVAPSWMMAPISTMPSADLKLMLCSSSSREWLLPSGTSLIWAKLSQAHPAPTAAANTINTIKNHINYTKHTASLDLYSAPFPTCLYLPCWWPARIHFD